MVANGFQSIKQEIKCDSEGITIMLITSLQKRTYEVSYPVNPQDYMPLLYR